MSIASARLGGRSWSSARRDAEGAARPRADRAPERAAGRPAGRAGAVRVPARGAVRKRLEARHRVPEGRLLHRVHCNGVRSAQSSCSSPTTSSTGRPRSRRPPRSAAFSCCSGSPCRSRGDCGTKARRFRRARSRRPRAACRARPSVSARSRRRRPSRSSRTRRRCASRRATPQRRS